MHTHNLKHLFYTQILGLKALYNAVLKIIRKIQDIYLTKNWFGECN